jgi:hypothetical protein
VRGNPDGVPLPDAENDAALADGVPDATALAEIDGEYDLDRDNEAVRDPKRDVDDE